MVPGSLHGFIEGFPNGVAPWPTVHTIRAQ